MCIHLFNKQIIKDIKKKQINNRKKCEKGEETQNRSNKETFKHSKKGKKYRKIEIF